MTSPAASQSVGQRAPDVLNPTGDVSHVSAQESLGIDACVHSPRAALLEERFGSHALQAPSTSVMFRMFRVQTIRTRVSQQRKGHPTGYATRGRPRPAFSADDERSATSCSGFSSGAIFSPLPAGEGSLSTSLGLGTPPALLDQRLADTAGVINPELLTSRLGAAPVPGSAPACAAGPRTTAAVALGSA